MAADPEFYYYYRGAKRALLIDTDTVDVKFTPQSPSLSNAAGLRNFASRASIAGFDPADIGGDHTDGWMKIRAAKALEKIAAGSQKEKHRRLLDNLTTLPDLEFASPVFKDAGGNPLSMNPRLIIAFTTGTAEALQSRALAQIPHAKAVTRIGRNNVWLVEMNLRHGFDLLDAANRLATESNIRYAEPDFRLSVVR